MIVCLCHRVSDRDIARHVQAGCASFDQLQARSRVATGCGCCRDSAQQAYHHARAGCACGRAPNTTPAPASALACAA